MAILVLALGGCGESERVVWVPEESSAMAEALLDGVEGFRVESAPGGSDAAAIALVPTETCAGCYSVVTTARGVRVEGDAPAGLGYGLTEVLEAMGYRFPHPFDTVVPQGPAWPPPIDEGERSPEVAVRGLQLHTLHPIEALEPMLEPGPENLERGEAILTWLARHRANYAQWVPLDEPQRFPDRRESWRDHQRALIEHAHALGLDVGLGIQLFGASNLQRAFDLVDDDELDDAARREEMRARLQILAGIDLDAVNINFGEFSSTEPTVFIEALDEATRLVREELGADTEVSATIHVGDSEEQKVVYLDQELIYYFLVQFASEPLTPWVHTVMWYGIDDPAGGVYHHDDFGEHRDLIRQRMADGEPVVYFPETAYWVAWDINIPLYAPIYARNRAADLDLMAGWDGELHGHVIFSSGWEWGYWQNDLVSLRASYERTPRWTDHLAGIYRGADEGLLLDAMASLADLQQRAFVDEALSPYLAGRDNVIELGFMMDVVGQPDRVEPAVVAGLSGDALARYQAIASDLAALAEEAEALAETVAGLELADDCWTREAVDGFAIAALRARFAARLHGDLANDAATADTLSALDAILAEAQAIADRRHEDLHHVDPEAILARRRSNPTLYQYGYLREATDLCFWRRERAKLANALGGDERVPPCVL